MRKVQAAALAVAIGLAAMVGIPVAIAAPPPIDNVVNPIVDTNDHPIDAHDGDILRADDGYIYMYGTAYNCGFTLNQDSPYCGVRVYRSTSMASGTWEQVGAVGGYAFNHLASDWQDICTVPSFGCYRPHVIQRASDGKYVMWVNTHHGDPGEAGYRTLVSDNPEGPFVDTGQPVVLADDPDDGGLEHGDFDITVDEDTGIAYVVYTVIPEVGDRHYFVVEQLTADGLTGTGNHQRVQSVGTGNEAPSLFQAPNGIWHIVYGPASPYGVVPAYRTSALEPIGRTWIPPVSFQAGNSCSGQPQTVTDLGNGLYVWGSDRWVQSPGGLVGNQEESMPYYAPVKWNGVWPSETQGCEPYPQLP